MTFVSSIKLFRCYLRFVKCQHWFSGPSFSTMRLVWLELILEDIIQMFSDEKCIPALFLSYYSGSSYYPTEGICSGLEFSGWSLPVSFTLVLVTLSLHRNLSFFIELVQHIVYGWIVMLLYAQRYFLHNTYCCLHST